MQDLRDPDVNEAGGLRLEVGDLTSEVGDPKSEVGDPKLEVGERRSPGSPQFNPWLRPRPRWGAYSAPPDPLAGFKGAILLRGGREGKGRGRGRKG